MPTPLKKLVACVLLLAFSITFLPACELCAIYSANNAREDAGRGFLFTIAEQYVSQHNLQVEGTPVTGFPFYNAAFLDSSYTYLAPGYNFSSWIGLNLNVPIVPRDF